MFSGSNFPPQIVPVNASCRHCGKEFKSHKGRTNHEEICRAKALSSRTGEDDDQISNTDLLAMIRLQRKEIEWLKRELGFAKTGERRQKKVEIVQWLNDNVRPQMGFTGFLQLLEGSVENMNTVFDHGYLHGTTLLLAEKHAAFSKGEVPIMGFTQKEGKLFRYEGGEWGVLTEREWDAACVQVKKVQMMAFDKWKEQEITDVFEIRQQNLWLDRMQRLQCLPPYGCAGLETRMRKKFYQHIRTSFKELSDCNAS